MLPPWISFPPWVLVLLLEPVLLADLAVAAVIIFVLSLVGRSWSITALTKLLTLVDTLEATVFAVENGVDLSTHPFWSSSFCPVIDHAPLKGKQICLAGICLPEY